MRNYYVTFGQRYHREEHPFLGFMPLLPDGWVRVEAESEVEARNLISNTLGVRYSSLYSEEEWTRDDHPAWYPQRELAVLLTDSHGSPMVKLTGTY